MKHFATALTDIISRCFDGNRSTLAKLAKVSPSTIARFCSGDVEPTLDRLEDICRVLNRHDRRLLLMAASRDRIPAEYQDEVFGDEDPASQVIRAKLPPDLAAVIRYLEGDAMKDAQTASYLRRIGCWVGILDPAKVAVTSSMAQFPDPRYSSRVADEPRGDADFVKRTQKK